MNIKKITSICALGLITIAVAYGSVSEKDALINRNIEEHKPLYAFSSKSTVDYIITDYTYSVRVSNNENILNLRPTPYYSLLYEFLSYTDDETEIKIIEKVYVDSIRAKAYYDLGKSIISGNTEQTEEEKSANAIVDAMAFSDTINAKSTEVIKTIKLADLIKDYEETGEPYIFEREVKGVISDGKIKIKIKVIPLDIDVKIKNSGWLMNDYELAPVYMLYLYAEKLY